MPPIDKTNPFLPVIPALPIERDVSALPVEPCSEHRFPCHAAFASAPLALVWLPSTDEGVHLQIKHLLLLLPGSSHGSHRLWASCSQLPTKAGQCSLQIWRFLLLSPHQFAALLQLKNNYLSGSSQFRFRCYLALCIN